MDEHTYIFQNNHRIVRAQCVAISGFFDACKIVVLTAPSDTPDLAPGDYHLIPTQHYFRQTTNNNTHIHLTALFPGLPR